MKIFNLWFIALFFFLSACSTPGVTPSKKYLRRDWGTWADEDKNCRDTRSEILVERSLKEVSFDKKGCRVVRGEWDDYYYPDKIVQASDADIDHLVPLKNAHLSGADQWDEEKRKEFANDPANLVITLKKFNRQKGAKGIDAWLPKEKRYACQYIKDFQKIKKKYDLALLEAEKDTVKMLTPECLELN